MIYADHLMAEESISRYRRLYGSDLVWEHIPLSDDFYVRELRRQLAADDPFLGYEICAAAHSTADNAVLYIGEDNGGRTHWRLYHLICKAGNFRICPEYTEFSNRTEALKYIKEHAKADR